MTFQESLDEYLRAIRERDLPTLVALLPDDELTLITVDGGLVRSVDEYVAAHREWFNSTSWSVQTRLEVLTECEALGLAVVHVDYRDDPPDGPRVRDRRFRSLGFARVEDHWVMIHDQCTRIAPTP